MNETPFPIKSGQTTPLLRERAGQAGDGELVKLSLAGSREAFYDLVKRYTRWVYAVIYHKIGYCQEQDDLLQEVFLTAWTSLSKLKEPAKFGSWLYGMTINICLAWLRKKKKDGTAREELKKDMKHSFTAGEPATEIDYTEILRPALEQLAPEYREVIYLYHFERKSYQEIADFLGVSAALVNKRLTTARKHLREGVQRMR
ncbi:MAG: sigma-70 family RNA polymerase sigma factor [Planctomycetota bacterium]